MAWMIQKFSRVHLHFAHIKLGQSYKWYIYKWTVETKKVRTGRPFFLSAGFAGENKIIKLDQMMSFKNSDELKLQITVNQIT